MISSKVEADSCYMNADERRTSLYNRYIALGEEASVMCKEREALQEDIETMLAADLRLDQEDKRLRAATRAAEQSTLLFYQKIDELQIEYQLAGESLKEVTVGRDAARQRKDNLVQLIQQDRLSYLETSVEFRASCKRLRASASACGLEQAAVQAYMEMRGLDPSLYESLCNMPSDLDDLEGDPTTWNNEVDQEMAELLEKYLEQKRAHDGATEELERAAADKQAARSRVDSRQTQHDNLQRQMERITCDNAELELQIHNIRRLTDEAKQRKAALVRRKSISNPYAQKKTQRTSYISNTMPPMTTSTRGNAQSTYDNESGELVGSTRVADLPEDRQAYLQSIALGTNGIRAAHHAAGGRSRRGQHFGSRLHVEGDAFVHPSVKSSTGFEMTSEDDNEDGDEETEDDGVLEFVAFASKKSFA